MNDDVLTRNDDGELSVRTVSATETSTVVNPNDVYTRDTDGNLAIRTVGGSGGGSGGVASVNGKKGVVVLTAKDVSAVPQYETMPTASASNLGNIVQYSGESGETYTNGYFYKNNPVITPSSATISQTSGVIPGTATFTTIIGNVSISADPEDVENWYLKYWNPAVSDTIIIVDSGNNTITVASSYYGGGFATTQAEMEAEGFVFSGTFGDGEQVRCNFVPTQELKNLSVDVETFEDAEQPTGNETISFVCTQVENPETIWEKDGVPVTLSDYGISFTGTPSLNDELTVVYLAPSVIGYNWEQVNVQPEQNVGIDWKVKLDLPAEYSGDLWNAFPVYTIEGGLPDGKYKFYFSTKQYSDYSQSSDLYAEGVFYVLLNIQNNVTEYQGIMGYVFDGEYIPSPNFARALDQVDVYTFIGKIGNNTVIASTNEPFSSGVLGAFGFVRLVPECFKISAITNIETGEEYIPTGYVPLDGQIPSDFNAYSGRLVLSRLGNPPSIPSRSIFRTFLYSETNNNFGFRISTTQVTKLYVRCSSGDDVFYAYVYKTPNEYEQEILQATGKFENWKFRFNPTIDYNVDIDFGTPDFTDPVSVVMGAFSADAASYFDISFVPTSADLFPQVCPYVGIGKLCRMETPTANQLGGVIQYVGETDANYTKGANYTAKGTIVVIPESAVATNIDPNIATISIDASVLIQAVSAYTGWSEQYVREHLSDNYWNIQYDFDNNQITSAYWAVWGGFDSSVFPAFTVTPESGQSGIRGMNFDIQYTPESKEVQNGHWELLYVQPDLTSIAGYDATKTQILKNVNGTITWVDE